MEKLTVIFYLASSFLTTSMFASPGISVNGGNQEKTSQQIVSWVDTSLENAEKFMLCVDGKPFYSTNVQVRLDKLKANNGFDAEARENAIKLCADYNFNTVSIPIHWREVEPEKDKFNWSILDEYLGLCLKYDIHMEMLWFSWSSGGTVQYLNSSQLRTPDYICSQKGTSDYTIINKTSPWTLDWYDDNLMNREKLVMDSIMHHVSEWDIANDSPHTLIGIQLGNEPQGYGQDVSNDRIIEYYSKIGSAVKESDYVVWTRLNCVTGKTNSHIEANEKLRNTQEGTNIDFVGIDVYGTTADKILGDCGGQFKKKGKNYMMIMESGAEVADASHYMMAALRGGKAYAHYDLAGIDNHGLFDVSEKKLIKHGSYVDDISNNNYIIKVGNENIARLAQGKGMYVYNYNGQGVGAEKGLDGIYFKPYAYYSHAIALRCNATQYLLLTSARGTFTIPFDNVSDITRGSFDESGNWIVEDTLQLTSSKSVTVKTPSAILLNLSETSAIRNVESEYNSTLSFNINGTIARQREKGIYIKDGKKFLY